VVTPQLTNKPGDPFVSVLGEEVPCLQPTGPDGR
jgi:hypothetical protein